MKKISSIAALAVILMISYSAVFYASDGGNERITVLSYNIRHGAGTDDVIDLSRIAAVIKSVDPDIVSLQEVDVLTKRSGGVDQAQELGRLTGMQAVFSPSMDHSGGKYGNAVLTKLSIESSKVLPLPGEPRSALFLKLKKNDSGMHFVFIATHFDTDSIPRMASIPLIEKEYETMDGLPAILAGDLNALPHSTVMTELFKRWCSTVSTNGWYTFPSQKPSMQIDYILFRPCSNWRVVKSEVPEESVASDHRAIMSVLELIQSGAK